MLGTASFRQSSTACVTAPVFLTWLVRCRKVGARVTVFAGSHPMSGQSLNTRAIVPEGVMTQGR